MQQQIPSGVTPSAIGSLGCVSADSHVNEPRTLWRENLPAALRSVAMEGIEAGAEAATGSSCWRARSSIESAGDEADRLKVCDPEHRYAMMRAEGMVPEYVFRRSASCLVLDRSDGGARLAASNGWIAATLGKSPRFACAGLVPTWRVKDALVEVERIANAGLSAVMLPAVADPTWNHPSWAPLWSAIAETGLPVVIHQGTGHSMYFYRGPGAGVSNLLATQSMGPRTAALLATYGVLADHPDLHVVFVEFNVGWLGWTMQTLDYYTDAFRHYGVTPSGKTWINAGSARTTELSTFAARSTQPSRTTR